MGTHSQPVNPIAQNVLDQLRVKLEHERLRLAHALEKKLGRHELAEGDPAGDEADVAERTAEPEVALRLQHQYEETLRAVDAAIARMESGSYGINPRTGELIPIARLEAVPWATE
jgi:DnaK suppressor protein